MNKPRLGKIFQAGMQVQKQRKRGRNDDNLFSGGASLGALTDKFPAWNEAFWQHLDIAIDLHKIQKVIVMDHRDCGAYKVILGEDFFKDRAKETKVHTSRLKELLKLIKEKHPKLAVELFLMDLDGKAETIT